MQKFPLEWPVGYPRTDRPKRSAFKNTTVDSAKTKILSEIARLNGKDGSRWRDVDAVISTNIPLRLDGYPRADYLRSKIDDKGVAVYFKHGGKDIVMCCDKWDTIESNLHAVYLSIEALRAVDRWGVSDFIERSFAGFKALPENTSCRWWEILGFNDSILQHKGQSEYFTHIKAHYRDLSKKAHPDSSTGSVEKFQRLNTAYEQAKDYFGV